MEGIQSKELSILLNLSNINKFNVILKVFIIGLRKKKIYTIDGIYVLKISDSFMLHLITKTDIFKTDSIPSVQRSLNGWGCIYITVGKGKYLYHPFFTRYIRDNVSLPYVSDRRKVFSRIHSAKDTTTIERNNTTLKPLIMDDKSLEINECLRKVIKGSPVVTLFNCDIAITCNTNCNQKRKLADTVCNKKRKLADTVCNKKRKLAVLKDTPPPKIIKLHSLIDETEIMFTTKNILSNISLLDCNLDTKYEVLLPNDIEYYILYYKMEEINNKIQWEF